jgi:hypothetical protein
VTPVEPHLNFQAVAPIAWVGIGAMAVLVLEVLLARMKSFLGRPLTEAYVSGALAFVASVALAVAVVAACQAYLAGDSVVFNAQNPMIRLDRFASFSSWAWGPSSPCGSRSTTSSSCASTTASTTRSSSSPRRG